jgi:hypothetical protein
MTFLFSEQGVDQHQYVGRRRRASVECGPADLSFWPREPPEWLRLTKSVAEPDTVAHMNFRCGAALTLDMCMGMCRETVRGSGRAR